MRATRQATLPPGACDDEAEPSQAEEEPEDVARVAGGVGESHLLRAGHDQHQRRRDQEGTVRVQSPPARVIAHLHQERMTDAVRGDADAFGFHDGRRLDLVGTWPGNGRRREPLIGLDEGEARVVGEDEERRGQRLAREPPVRLLPPIEESRAHGRETHRLDVRRRLAQVKDRVGMDRGGSNDVRPPIEGVREKRADRDHIAHGEEPQTGHRLVGIEVPVLAALERVRRGFPEKRREVVDGVGRDARLVVDALQGRASGKEGQGLVDPHRARALVDRPVLHGDSWVTHPAAKRFVHPAEGRAQVLGLEAGVVPGNPGAEHARLPVAPEDGRGHEPQGQEIGGHRPLQRLSEGGRAQEARRQLRERDEAHVHEAERGPGAGEARRHERCVAEEEHAMVRAPGAPPAHEVRNQGQGGHAEERPQKRREEAHEGDDDPGIPVGRRPPPPGQQGNEGDSGESEGQGRDRQEPGQRARGSARG